MLAAAAKEITHRLQNQRFYSLQRRGVGALVTKKNAAWHQLFTVIGFEDQYAEAGPGFWMRSACAQY